MIFKREGYKIIACYKNSSLSVDSVLNSEYGRYWDLITDQTLASFWAIQFISIRGIPECSYKRFAFSVIPPYLLAIAPCTEIRILESWKRLVVGSGIREMFAYGTRNTTQGIRNPIKECNPESKFHWQYSVSSTWN